ncbi:MAG: cation diffusion facilitator family transporter [Bacilli bacterium]
MKTEKNILIAFILNLSFALFEIVGGILTNSVAILSDAIHDLGDALSIGISFFLEKKSKKKPNKEYTFGYARYSVLGALITTSILTVGSLFMIVSSIIRLFNPVTLNYNGMILIAVIGTIVNLAAVFITKKGDSLNQKSVNLHMFEDVLGWIVVLIGSILMNIFNISVLDSIMSIGIAIFILIHAILNLNTILNLFLEKTPNNININELEKELLKIKGVKNIHHIHVWSLDGINNFITLHAILEDKMLIKEINKKLKKFGITHSTIQTEDIMCEDKECSMKES